VIVRGLKRLAVIFLTMTGATALLSLAVGLAAGSSVLRALSVGFMLTGSFVFCVGAAITMRGPLRPTHREDGSRSGVRVAPPEELTEGLHLSAIMIGLGLFLVLFGIAVDPRTRLF
jgi:hypothetical protein